MKNVAQGELAESWPLQARAARSDILLEVALTLLLIVTFFIGPLKMIGAGWLSYVLPDALGVLVLLIVFVGRAVRGQPLFAASPLTIPILFIAVLCFLQLANPAAPFIRSVMGLRTWLLYLAFYFVGFYGFRSLRQVVRLYGLLLTLGCLAALYGLYQWRAGPQVFANWSDQYGHYAKVMWSAGLFRAFSTFLLPNTFGSNMGFLMFVAFGVAASSILGRRARLAAAAAFVLMGAGMAASGTRAPLVELVAAGLIGLTVLPGIAARFRLAVTGLVLFSAVALFVLGVIGPEISRRFGSLFQPDQFFWKWFEPLVGGLGVAMRHPFGLGTAYTGGVPQMINNPVLRDLPTTTIDSGYGSAAAELGLLGFAAFGYLAVKVAFEGVRAWGRLRPGRLRDAMLAPALLCCNFPVLGLIGGVHASLPSSIYYWLLIGVLMKAPSLQRHLAEVPASANPTTPIQQS